MSIPETPTEILPLFPLNVVLFPQSQLHLHIFEERYKTLINECIKFDSVFGIILVHEQQVRTIGCTANVKTIMQRYDDGKMDIVVEGRRRFQLHNFVEAPHPYYSGRISWMEDVDEEVDEQLRTHAVNLYNQFVKVVFTGIVQQVDVNNVRKARAFHLVQKSGMELIERQVFLAMNSENKRLQFLIQHLESLLPLLLSKKSVEELAKNDGYVQE
jgi:Lon protease-like protein